MNIIKHKVRIRYADNSDETFEHVGTALDAFAYAKSYTADVIRKPVREIKVSMY